MAGQHPAALLRLPHNGGTGNYHGSGHGARGPVSLARATLFIVGPALEPDAVDSISVHCNHGWMDDGGTGAAALVDLRSDAHGKRCFCERIGGERSLQPLGVYGTVHGAWNPLFVSHR